jgi:hypothetical protein
MVGQADLNDRMLEEGDGNNETASNRMRDEVE